jgi:glycosyltransferase involved in cell wall biosynthesis
MPWAVGWRLPPCDLVISSSHCVAKGVRVPDGVPHICYCHTPMRYAWSLREQYFGARRGPKAWLRDKLLDALQRWDRRTASGVTHFIANSRVVQERIRSCYGRDSVVIHPPVDTDYYCPAAVPREDYYLVVSAFAPYKRLDLAVAACNRLQRRLVVIGSGQAEKSLRALAGPTVEFLGWQPDDVVRDHLRRCRALVFPGEEDFGIVPLEAQACGAPVIAFGRGGATETVVPLQGGPGPATGVWFAEQTVDCLREAMLTLERERDAFATSALRRHARRFDARRFAEELFGFVDDVVGATVGARKAA